ncbi:MAG TPA: DUF1549 and DUF1553 domain-containing protein [Pirellulaceae bacterium]|nr:DUF1549 and DUF1553 domain-containing protein [Pirellulaceae bacterium]
MTFAARRRPSRRSSLACALAALGLAALGLAALFCHDAPARADEHWAFRRLAPVVPPNVQSAGAARTDIDRFLLEKLAARGLTFSAPADRYMLARRLSYDLRGLPPTVEELTDFAAEAEGAAGAEGDADSAARDKNPDALERLVDRWLASPRYGERWAKYWLDAAGYADSNGYFAADTDRPNAWRYRDYVVRAYNLDMPLDQFIREQIAGDELSGWEPGKPATREQLDALIATHYLRNGPDGSGESDGNPDEVRVDRYSVLESMAQILGSSLFGLTLQCGKCHDHKFEPVTQRDYYQLQAIFYPAFNVEKWKKPQERFVEIDGQKISWLTDLEPTPPAVKLLVRGDPKHPGDPVEPDVPESLRDAASPFRVERPEGGRTTGRRAAMASWLTARDTKASSLLARVTMNRVWQSHFGTGIVATPENLGLTGAAPTHEALLEHLADELWRDDGRLKRIQRRIVTSAAFRQTSQASDASLREDPDARWLSRFPLRRLDSDAVRDSLLAASGELDQQIGGAYVPTKRQGSGEIGAEESNAGFRRRSLYLQQRRTQVDTLLATFDAPSIVNACPKRPVTTTPLQSLQQLNSSFCRGRAVRMYERLTSDAGDMAQQPTRQNDAPQGSSPRDASASRVDTAFLLAAGRPPSDKERRAIDEFLRDQQTEYGGGDDATRRAWIDLCQMLLAGNSLLYVE